MREIKEINARFKAKKAEDILAFLSKEYPGRVAFASSMGAEDQVILDMIVKNNLKIDIFYFGYRTPFP